MTDENGPSKEAIASFYSGMEKFRHLVVAESALVDKPVGVNLLGRRLVLARLGADILAMGDICRHFPAQLSLGEIVQVNGRPALQCSFPGSSRHPGPRSRCLSSRAI